MIHDQDQEERIEYQGKDAKHCRNVELPNQSKHAEKITHSQRYAFQHTFESFDSAEMSNFEKINIQWHAF